MPRIPLHWMLASTAVAVEVAAYARFGRPRVLNWGATPDEVARTMPGDDIVPNPEVETTRCISIAAPVECVWPWLIQMGPRPRAGVYTYDWIERRLGIDIENADRILTEFQNMEAGDTFLLNEKGTGLTVRAVETGRAIVLQWVPAGSTWTFALYPDGDGRTRLISRNRIPPAGLKSRLFMFLFMEPGSLVMERKMLLGIKVRAERSRSQRAAPELNAWYRDVPIGG